MARAYIPENIWYHIYSEAFTTTTLLDGLIPIDLDGITKPQVKHWSGGMPAYVQHLCTWGEAGTVTIKSTMHQRLRTEVCNACLWAMQSSILETRTICGTLLQEEFMNLATSFGCDACIMVNLSPLALR